ncbi:MAG: DUF1232 domain-containing protein [Armatimonadetes bacterium]|nr:DUF1232 domain-containing protein [Armatimonadota bacterium]
MDKVLPAAPRAPWSALLSVLVALFYDVSPVDLIPDLIPLLGWFDDGVVTVVLAVVAVASWRKWAKKRRTVALAK